MLEYANAPRAYEIDPTFCPVKRWYTWAQYELITKQYPEYLNNKNNIDNIKVKFYYNQLCQLLDGCLCGGR